MFTRSLSLLAALVLAVLATGCAHPISLTTELPKSQAAAKPKINKAVGYYIADADRAREVVTPGGGGDKVKYQPYRDLETGIYWALSENFASVTKLSSPDDAQKLAKDAVALVIKPVINTTSSSSSAFTWPPTAFTIEFVCTVADAQGKPITEVKASGAGAATFNEFKSDFSLSARRASQAALADLAKKLGEAPELRR